MSNNRRRVTPKVPGEETDHYPRVVLKWTFSETRATRIIVCRHALQWIIQDRVGTRQGSPVWRSRHFCRTRAALMRLLPAKAEEIAAVLPEMLTDGE